MRRSLAFLTLLTLSWAHLALLWCATDGTAAHERTTAVAPHHDSRALPTGEREHMGHAKRAHEEPVPSHRHDAEPADRGCLMAASCGAASVEPPRTATIRIVVPAPVRTGQPPVPSAGVAAAAVEPPPPRYSV